MTSTITITGKDPKQARVALADLLKELSCRSTALIDAGRSTWPGSPDLRLVADELTKLLADPDCRELFRRVLASGRKLGLSGVAYSSGERMAGFGGCSVIGALLAAGKPLTHTTTASATSNATATHR
jgi:hypothetical protein